MKAPIRVYNHFLDLLMETDNYQSLQFKRSYHSVGDFELHINRYMHGAEYFQKGNIIALNKQNNKVGIILSREIALDENGKETENFRLTGKTLDSVMDRRVTVPPSNTSHDRKKGNAETVMKHYVYNHFVNPADPNRRMPIIEIAPNRNRGENVDWESRYKSVADELESISIESNLGWGIFADFNNKKLIFDVFHSKDLTQGNEEGNSPVFFSPEFETIKSQNFIDSDLELKNVGYVGGQGEGVERNIVMVGDEKGWGRFETFIDARDIGGEDPETERELTPEEERELLIERGERKMKEMETILSLEAEILTPITRDSYEWSHEGYLHPAQPTGKYVRKPQQVTPFQYEIDFDLGDRVQVVNKSWRLTMTAPITELTEIHEPGGFRLEATFGQTRPTLNSKLKDKFDEIEGVDKQELPAKVAVERMKEAIKYSDEKLTKEERERIEQAKENLERSLRHTDTKTSDTEEKTGVSNSAMPPIFKRPTSRTYKGRVYGINEPIFDDNGLLIQHTEGESLEIPTKDSIHREEGTIEMSFTPLTLGGNQHLLRMDFSGGGRFLFFVSESNRITFSIDDWGGGSVRTSADFVEAGKEYQIAIKWSEKTLNYSLFVNGEFIGIQTYESKGPFPEMLQVASTCDSIIHYLRISNVARKDEELSG